MFLRYIRSIFASALTGVCVATTAQSAPLDIYIDADFSSSAAAAEAIELGVQTALAEVDFEIAGDEIRIIAMDHRTNVKRARRTYETYLQNENALAIVGGKQSPPYLANLDFINNNGILSLIPWAAAGSITRGSEGETNWVFRLSVDDTQSGRFLVKQAIEREGCKDIALILLDTGWGRYNQVTLTRALEERGMSPVATEFFSAAIVESSAHSLAARIGRSGADCGIMLSNWVDGSLVLNGLHAAGTGIRIFSHWGIMGGKFTEHVSDETRQALKLRVLQTCGLRRESEGNPILDAALQRAAPELGSLADMPASTGFVHGYDLTRILIQAVLQAAEDDGWETATIQQKRSAVRNALEALQRPVPGILDTYDPPFAPFSLHATDSHEALGADDLCIAKFAADGRLQNAY